MSPASSSATSLASLTQVVAGLRGVDSADADAVKACCAAVYGLDLVALFLGESYHPGGAALTRRLADALHLQPGERVLDVGAGVGATARLLAVERGVEVVGIDLGDAQVARARIRVAQVGLADQVCFQVGDAERLPVEDGSFDAVVCECAFCTFPDKPTAAAELARAVRPGGRVGITDVWLDPDRLAADLRGLVGRIACLADARPIAEVTALLERVGLSVNHLERHDQALADTIERVENRLRALRLVDIPLLRGVDIGRAIDVARRAGDVVRRGDAGYMLIVADKPRPR